MVKKFKYEVYHTAAWYKLAFKGAERKRNVKLGLTKKTGYTLFRSYKQGNKYRMVPVKHGFKTKKSAMVHARRRK